MTERINRLEDRTSYRNRVLSVCVLYNNVNGECHCLLICYPSTTLNFILMKCNIFMPEEIRTQKFGNSELQNSERKCHEYENIKGGENIKINSK